MVDGGIVHAAVGDSGARLLVAVVDLSTGDVIGTRAALKLDECLYAAGRTRHVGQKDGWEGDCEGRKTDKHISQVPIDVVAIGITISISLAQ